MERYVGYGNIAGNLILHNHIFYSGKSPLVNRTWKGIESCKYIRENI